MILSIIGAYNREEVQTFLNALLSNGGVDEVRLLQMGKATSFTDMVIELKLVHDFEHISAVNMEDLIFKDKIVPEVLVFMNSSYQSLDCFTTAAFPLLTFIWKEIKKSKVKEMKILFGDNYRGLLQQAFLEKVMINGDADLSGFKFSVVSSIFQVSKTLNSTVDGSYFRCYPKVDESVYVFDPSGKMSTESETALTEELGEKLEMVEQIFTKKSSSSYPNIEGTVLAGFMKIYMQTKDWDIAVRDDWLSSRHPVGEEKDYYGVDGSVPIFLPPVADGEDTEVDIGRLPDLLIKHVKDASDFIESKLRSCAD